MSVSGHDHLWQWGRVVSGMCAGAAARLARGSRQGVRRAAHVDERAAIEFDAVDVQHAVTNPAVGVERLCAKVLRRCAKDYAGQDTVRQAQVRVLYVLASCASYLRLGYMHGQEEAGTRTQCVRTARMPRM